MEIYADDKKSELVTLIEKLFKANICDPSRLQSIKDSLEKDRTLYESDKQYLWTKYKRLQQQSSENLDLADFSQNKIDLESDLELIKKLQQSEIGDPLRLDSIRNYLTKGEPLIKEDKIYLKQKYEQLQKIKQNYVEQSSSFSNQDTDLPHPQKILIDDFDPKPVHSFDSLSKTITSIVRNSNPYFTIGIYGEWGTGKTTLMKAVETRLKEGNIIENENKIIPVWFNAWKYERVENVATVSLMKTLANALGHNEKFLDLSKSILKGLTIFGNDIIQQLTLNVVSRRKEMLPEELDNKIEYINDLYKDSIYFEGLDNIKKEMQKIRQDDSDYRVVVFIDDLDRCSPKKALEVLESIKLFLDIEGFVFIIGLSYKTVTHLISYAYKSTGVKGEDYIKKIIQIPIKIPTWTKEDIVDLIEKRISSRLNQDYSRFLNQNASMVSEVVNCNPRQLKRFINNVIIAFETFANKEGTTEINLTEIFLVQILKTEWPGFYIEFKKNKHFREVLKWFISMPKQLRKYFNYLKNPLEDDEITQKNKRVELLIKISSKSGGKISQRQIEILSKFNFETWLFLENVKNVLFGIKNWEVIDNVTEIVEDFPYSIKKESKKEKPQKEDIQTE